MDKEKWEMLKQKIKDILKKEDITVSAAITILDIVKREIEYEALSKKI
ncbi:hypothetical protein [uncultured Clostridium sp.]|nr:hypothetical protein [uncultured Clostridium sp.]